MGCVSDLLINPRSVLRCVNAVGLKPNLRLLKREAWLMISNSAAILPVGSPYAKKNDA
jgi:hypothetical protein